MSASSIGAAKGGGYARYLEAKTIAPERGDYYLTPDGELTQAPGRWLADPETLDRLGVDPDGPASWMRARVQRWNPDPLLEALMDPVGRQARRRALAAICARKAKGPA